MGNSATPRPTVVKTTALGDTVSGWYASASMGDARVYKHAKYVDRPVPVRSR